MRDSHSHPFKININSFNQLFREQYPALRAYAGLLIGEEAAEDMVQDVFAATWENKDTITIHTSVKAYLFRAVHNRCLNKIQHLKMVQDHHRRLQYAWTEQEILLSDPDKNHIIQKLYRSSMRSAITAAIDNLPHKCREVFKLSYLDNYKNKEISELLHISVSTVEKHINHALKTLRKALQHIHLLLLHFFF
jgi:RNA polymerase sigma-70 factor (ECF subfamily)